MSEIKHTAGPWYFDTDKKGYGCEFSGFAVHSERYTVATVVTDTESLANAANARLIAAAPELLEAISKRVGDAEQRVFEEWLRRTAPSGDVERVQDLWEHSSEFCDFCDEWASERAAIAKATGSQS